MNSTLSLEEKRNTIFASVLRYQTEVIPLREKLLEKVVLASLIETSENSPLRLGRIRSNLSAISVVSNLRDNVIQETIDRLIKNEKVQKGEVRTRNAYFITQKGEEEVSSQIKTYTDILEKVLRNLLKDTEQFISYDLASKVCKNFIFQCFAEYGQLIAKQVCNVNGNDNYKLINVDAIFENATKKIDLEYETKESLKARCVKFLKSKDVDIEKLKFFLSQGYYFTQLLGIETNNFDPLNAEVFKNSCFYVDTNVLILGIVEDYNEEIGAFDELLGIAKKIGIEIKISNATIEEALKVIEDRKSRIKTIVNKLSPALYEKTKDQFLLTFVEIFEKNPEFTVEEFFEPFNNLEEYISNRWNLKITNIELTEILEGDYTKELEIINSSAEESRGWGKSENVQRHDLLHFILTKKSNESKKTWFLTRDRTLIKAAHRFEKENYADFIFTFPITGFLHSISPFVSVATEEAQFADMLSGLLNEQIFNIEAEFDVRELALIAEYHEDVMSTPSEDLIMAFDFIKTAVLRDKKYSKELIPEVSLQLKKYLTASKDERLEQLKNEKAKIRAEYEKEQENTKKISGEKVDLENKLKGALDQHSMQTTQIAELKQSIADIQSTTRKDKRNRWLIYSFVGISLSVCIWLSDSWLFSTFPYLSNTWIKIFLDFLSVLLSVLPTAKWISLLKWTSEIKQVSIIILLALVLFISQFLNNEQTGIISNIFGVASVIGLGLFLFLGNKKTN
jgi:predicted transcriptional regulator